MPTHRTTLLAAAMLTMATSALSTPTRAQEPPRPAPEIRRMTALAGEFAGDAQFTTGGKTVRFTLHHTNRIAAGGFGLAVHETADVPGVGRYEADNLVGWDTSRRQLHLFTVTNDPYTHDHAGRWSDATHAELRYEGVREGRKLVEVLPLEVVGADEYRFRSTVTVPGRPSESFVATMKRVASSPGH